jgi:enolase-phosphatase E1
VTLQAILTDIEGTTTSVSFVYEVLFPYARERLVDYVRDHAATPAVRAVLADTAQAAGLPRADDAALVEQLLRWAAEDRKIAPLKTLQGLIWEQGYRDRNFTGHVYADAATTLRRWHTSGLRLYVYSSGSVQAQRLLFGHSDAGDLTPLFSGFFDTTSGGKREASSYARIATAVGLPAGRILFLSDIGEELDAARSAGMDTAQLVRDARTPAAPGHPQCADFDAVATAFALP